MRADRSSSRAFRNGAAGPGPEADNFRQRRNTKCPSANNQSGALPTVLLTQQTNAQNQVGGPFLNSTPSLPAGWTGSGTSYKYSSSATGTFMLCGSGDSTAANSNGGATCP